MFLYGIKAKKLKKQKIADECSYCHESNSLILTLFQKYAHLFYIPFFPMSKTAAVYCSHCKKVIFRKQFNKSIYQQYEDLKHQSKIPPIWTYSGIFLIVLLLISGIVSYENAQERNARIISSPREGDIYEINRPNNEYALYKIDRIAGDTLFLVVNQYKKDPATGIVTVQDKEDRVYSNHSFPMLKSDLKRMYDEKNIIDIERQ
jgi:hypothetical protein